MACWPPGSHRQEAPQTVRSQRMYGDYTLIRSAAGAAPDTLPKPYPLLTIYSFNKNRTVIDRLAHNLH